MALHEGRADFAARRNGVHGQRRGDLFQKIFAGTSPRFAESPYDGRKKSTYRIQIACHVQDMDTILASMLRNVPNSGNLGLRRDYTCTSHARQHLR